jgi:uncharacterized protein YuzE
VEPTVDRDGDVVYIRLSNAEVDDSETSGRVRVDVDENGNVVGVAVKTRSRHEQKLRGERMCPPVD